MNNRNWIDSLNKRKDCIIWKVEGEEDYNIGELVIDNDYIKFFVRGKSIPWAWTFRGSNGEHPMKVYAKGPRETKHRSLNTNSVSIGFTEKKELYAIKEKIEHIIIKMKIPINQRFL